MIHMDDKETSQLIASTIYYIWYARNKLVFHNNNIYVLDTNMMVASINTDFQNINKINIEGAPSEHLVLNRRNIGWSPLGKAELKLNVDAHHLGDGSWGLGLVLRRDDGSPVVVGD